MSVVNDEKKVVDEGRKNTQEGQGEAPLRDQIATKLFAQLKDLDIGVEVRKLWMTGNAERSEWLKRQQEYLAEWDEFILATDDGAFAGSSNLHLPMPFIVAKTLHARMIQAVDGVDPGIKPRREDSINAAQTLQALTQYALKDWANNYQGISEVLDSWVWSWITTGVGVLKQRWDVRFARYVDAVPEVVQGFPELTQAPDGTTVALARPQLAEREKEVVEKVFDGPAMEWVAHEDILIIGGQGNPQDADAVLHRHFMTASDLWSLVDQKIFDKEAVEEIIMGGEDKMSVGEGSNIKQDAAFNSGKNSVDSEVDLDRYEIVEAYLRKNVDGSGINSDIVVWVGLRTGSMAKATYLRRMTKSGMRPFTKIDFYKRPGQEMGIGLIEIMLPLSTELDALHNLRIDYGMFSTMPFFFYRPSGSMKAERIPVEPGMGIPLDNPQQDVFFPNIGNRTSFGFNEESGIMNMIERLTSVSDISLGIVSSQQGAARTATGARGLQTSESINLSVHLRRLVKGWRDSLKYLVHMLQQRAPAGLAFRITGEDGQDQFHQLTDPEQLAADVDIEITTDASASNPTVQQGVAQQILQTTLNPLLIQVGAVGPNEIYEASRNFYKSLGILDSYRFLKRPPQYRVVITPEEELRRIINGQVVPVLPDADHEGFIALAEEVFKNDDLLAQYSPGAAQAIQAQRIQHEQMKQALEQQQRESANQRQQVINLQQGAPDGSAAGAGGVGGGENPDG